MSKLIQCVPNFSEGRRAEVVNKIVDAIDFASGVKIVDYSMDADHNRSVVTFIGGPEDIHKSVLAGARVAIDLIDLNKHTGGHPRVGAVDVVPVVPLDDTTMDEAVELGRAVGSDIAESMQIPVYFYEKCALRSHYINLADVRKDGFEALKNESLENGREPDAGPSHIHPTAGATVVGARGPLIAYNVNLKSNNISAAKAIATKIRHLRNSGEAMSGVKAIGVYLKSRDTAQVSMNITQPHLVSMWDIYSFIKHQAHEMGIELLESELIGALREHDITDKQAMTMNLKGYSRSRILDNWMREFE